MHHNTLLRPFSPYRAAMDEYLLTLESEGKAPATIAAYRLALRRLQGIAGEVEPAELDAGALRRFLRHLQQEGLSATTQADYLRAIKTWLRWLHDEGGYGVDLQSVLRVRPPRIVSEPVLPFTEAEIGLLVVACGSRGWLSQRTRTIVALLLDTGVRASELCGLRLTDVDLEHGQIVVRAATDKTRKGRTIALGRRARLEMGRWYSTKRRHETQLPDSAWFLGKDGQAPTRNALFLLLQRLGQRAGVSGVHPHRFRHTFAILALRSGMSPFAVMQSLGHTDLSMTKRYMRLVDADVSIEKRAKSPLDRLKVRF